MDCDVTYYLIHLPSYDRYLLHYLKTDMICILVHFIGSNVSDMKKKENLSPSIDNQK